MRTVFSSADKKEDGFVFLSDAFIRRLVGPASRIKEKRRLEALTSLHMLTNAALFGAWETGKLPADHAAVLAAAGLRPEDVAVPEGKGARWEAGRQRAVSDVYNTIHFATPLIELPLDKVTQGEADEYGRFREEYSKLWDLFRPRWPAAVSGTRAGCGWRRISCPWPAANSIGACSRPSVGARSASNRDRGPWSISG